MAAQTIFPKRSEYIETFDFSDIASGLGFELYYGTTYFDTTSTHWSLLPTALQTRATTTNQGGQGTLTINFDTSVFNLPRTAKGTAYISLNDKGSLTSSTSIKGQIAIVHADSTATNISSEFETIQALTSDTPELLALPLTQTTIKKGEKLRMILKIVVDATGGTGTLNHDNTNADTKKHLKLLMPFRIES